MLQLLHPMRLAFALLPLPLSAAIAVPTALAGALAERVGVRRAVASGLVSGVKRCRWEPFCRRPGLGSISLVFQVRNQFAKILP